MKKENGFSLVELIIATTIMVVLSVVAMVSYSGTNRRARDSKRVTDLQNASMALEMARQVGKTYPESIDDLVPGFMQAQIRDPKATNGYSYVYSRPTAYTYALYSYMEDLGSTNGSYSVTCGPSGATCNYQVKNP